MSGEYKRFTEETDLFYAYRPTLDEGEKSTLDAICTVEKILAHPERYRGVFRTRNVITKWRNSNLQDYVIFRAKYSYEWEQFCIKEQ